MPLAQHLLNCLKDADIVCSRAKNHYDPQGTLNFSETGTETTTAAATALEGFKRAYKDLHPNQARLMYFSVSYSNRSSILGPNMPYSKFLEHSCPIFRSEDTVSFNTRSLCTHCRIVSLYPRFNTLESLLPPSTMADLIGFLH